VRIKPGSCTIQFEGTRRPFDLTRCSTVRLDYDRSFDGTAGPPISDEIGRNGRLRRIVRKRWQLEQGQNGQEQSKRSQDNHCTTAKTAPQPRKRFGRLRAGQRRLIHPSKNAERREILKPNLCPREIEDGDIRLWVNGIHERNRSAEQREKRGDPEISQIRQIFLGSKRLNAVS
jgi:hypothetical protein